MKLFAFKYKNRSHALRIIFACIFFVLLWSAYNGGFISCLQQPVLKYLSVDNTFWLFHLTGIPQSLVGSYVLTIVLQSCMMLTLLLAIWKPNIRLYSWLFFLLFTIFGITFYSYSGSHNHGLIVIWLLVIPFLVTGEQTFRLLFRGIRYYFLFSFFSASLWKLCRGHVFQSEHMIHVLKEQLAHKLSYHTMAFSDQFSMYLISHPLLAQAFLWAAILTQLSFVVGFFTTKYDRLLFILALLFFVSNVFVMNIFSMMYPLFLLTLIPLLNKFQTNTRSINGAG